MKEEKKWKCIFYEDADKNISCNIFKELPTLFDIKFKDFSALVNYIQQNFNEDEVVEIRVQGKRKKTAEEEIKDIKTLANRLEERLNELEKKEAKIWKKIF